MRLQMMRIVTVLFALLLASIVISANLGWAKPVFVTVRMVPLSDKVAHFLLFGIMSLLLNLTLNGQRLRFGGLYLLKGTFILLVVATLEELTNLVAARRSFSLLDLTSNYAGIIFFGQVAARMLARSLGRAHESAAAEPARHVAG